METVLQTEAQMTRQESLKRSVFRKKEEWQVMYKITSKYVVDAIAQYYVVEAFVSNCNMQSPSLSRYDYTKFI